MPYNTLNEGNKNRPEVFFAANLFDMHLFLVTIILPPGQNDFKNEKICRLFYYYFICLPHIVTRS